jgi:hypothetical protein
MTNRPTRTLHEAIRLVLEATPGRSASTTEICDEIVRRKLYKQKSGGDAFAEQIFLRARNYPKWFEVLDRDHIELKLPAMS